LGFGAHGCGLRGVRPRLQRSNLKGVKDFDQQDKGRDCLICAIFARQRSRTKLDEHIQQVAEGVTQKKKRGAHGCGLPEASPEFAHSRPSERNQIVFFNYLDFYHTTPDSGERHSTNQGPVNGDLMAGWRGVGVWSTWMWTSRSTSRMR